MTDSPLASRLIGLMLGLAIAIASSAVDGQPRHGHALLGDLKYGPDFSHFDYVDPNAPKGGTVKLGTLGTFDSLNAFVLKGKAAVGLGLLYDTLMTGSLDERSAQYGLIAETIEIAPDNTWVIFNLRRAARWHDGTSINADDVIWSFDTLRAKGNPNYRTYWADVDKVEALAPDRVRFAFKNGNNAELAHILGQLPILPKAYYGKTEFDKTTLEPPLGSGPYRIAEVDAGRSITYERVPTYWAKDLAVNRGNHNFDRIRYDYFLDETVLFEAFKGHAYDFRAENSSKNWATGYDVAAVKQGLIMRKTIKTEAPKGLTGFIFNTRRPMFKDRRVREALSHTFDFEWSNANLFYGLYARMDSYFTGSELAARELPTPEELEVLKPFRGQVSDGLFTKAFEPPKTDGSGQNRAGLRAATQLLAAAGFKVKDQKLIDPATGQQMEIEFLIAQQLLERVIAPIVRNMERLGIKARIRIVDTSQYQSRIEKFDFDMIVGGWPQSLAPGNEQIDFFGSATADLEGSRNFAGIKDPVVDALIELVIRAPDRKRLIATSRALDRVLSWGHYVIPYFYLDTNWVAYWNKFGNPPTTPKYSVGFTTWWVDAEKDAALKRGETTLKAP
ncbi:MAG: ABC transporter substrate-binding protein [Alphaproteobacteria bacterium]|nr:ABC transporter substrate-binding protein [Alphaproteobacteria bacterium]